MKIKDIKAVKFKLPSPKYKTEVRRPAWADEAEVANPLSRNPNVKVHRSLWMPKWDQVACVVTAEDGTSSLGMTTYDAPVVSIINDHFAPILTGAECMATEKLWDMMFRLASPYSATGLASYAISAVDLALWDLKGKILNKPSMNFWAVLPGTKYSAMPPATTRNGIWSWDSKPRNWPAPTGLATD